MKLITYGAYVWLPVITALVWCLTLIGLLFLWYMSDDGAKYHSDLPSITFISKVGAAHPGWFTPGCILVSLLYIMTLFADRWLRHHDRIPQVKGAGQKIWGNAAVCHGILSAVALILLSSLSLFKYPALHWCFSFAFALSLVASSVCQVMEAFYLHKENPDQPHLRRSALLKFLVIPIAIGAGIIFAILYKAYGCMTSRSHNNMRAVGAVFEWTVCFFLTFYFLTFALDFRPAVKTSTRFKDPSDCDSDC
ncbi:hypothetical protein PSTT_09861 [Puccinia striiformis]|uniref:CWH43-like N-terminal domain-containing protein n=2 Tax=Puccinia striiformis TaxID=27350 RepID=A0A0L0VQU2_9BASI|nr:hypothetical protein PSTG_05479 [Puccinia striiformis f. sp. tritici PST-78]POW05231.1 hypothetical protein PSTT_09861 [Puccinia striiformis]